MFKTVDSIRLSDDQWEATCEESTLLKKHGGDISMLHTTDMLSGHLCITGFLDHDLTSLQAGVYL